MVGSAVPVVGTAVGGAVGAVVGGVVGSVVGSGALGFAAEKTKGFAVDLGQATANGAVDLAHGAAHTAEDAWNQTDGARHAISGALSSIPGL